MSDIPEKLLTVASILDDVEKGLTRMLNDLTSEQEDALDRDGHYIESWRDDIRTVQKLLGVNL